MLTPETIHIRIDFVRGDKDHRTYQDGSIDSAWISLDHSSPRRMKLEYRFTDSFYDLEEGRTFRTSFEEFLENAIELNALSSIGNPAIHEFEKFENELDQTLINFKEKMRIRHGLDFDAIEWREPLKKISAISEIRLKGTLYSSPSFKAARSLILQITEELRHEINNNEKLQEHLIEYPFPLSRLKLVILCRKYKFFVGEVPYYDTGMETITLNEDYISYHHYIQNPENNYKLRTTYLKETYQEAQQGSKDNPYTIKDRFCNWLKNFIYSILSFIGSVFSIFMFIFFAFVFSSGGLLFLLLIGSPIIILFLWIFFSDKKNDVQSENIYH